MGDWYMESGERSYHSGEFGYDKDNDAWVPLGDTLGTTPRWWHSKDDSYDSGRKLTPEKIAEREKYKREAEEWANYVKKTERLIAEKRAHAEKLDTSWKGGKCFAITVGVVDLIIIVWAAIVNVAMVVYPWFWFDIAIIGTLIGGIAYVIVGAVFQGAGSSEKKKADAMEKELENKKRLHRKGLLG